MQIHRVTGASLREALLRAQSEYGDEAVVIPEDQDKPKRQTYQLFLDEPITL